MNIEKFIKNYVKIYNDVIPLIIDNINKKDIEEFLRGKNEDLYNWYLDKYSGVVFELNAGEKYGIILPNAPKKLLSKFDNIDIIDFLENNFLTK